LIMMSWYQASSRGLLIGEREALLSDGLHGAWGTSCEFVET